MAPSSLRNSMVKMLRLLTLAGAMALFVGVDAGRGREEAVADFDPPVPYVPTPDAVVDLMLWTAEAGPGDVHYDLGSGDGRLVVAAVRDFAVDRSIGIDINPDRVREGRARARRNGVVERALFRQGDIFRADFSDATVLTLYLSPEFNARLRPRILSRMAPGTRVVSHDFRMGDWRPDDHLAADGSDVYLWIVPARIAGLWRGSADGRVISLRLRQEFQRVDGMISFGGAAASGSGPRSLPGGVPIAAAWLSGRDLRLSAVIWHGGGERRVYLDGRVEPGRIDARFMLDGQVAALTLKPAE